MLYNGLHRWQDCTIHTYLCMAATFVLYCNLQSAGGGWGNASSQTSLDTGQLAREQAQRLYNQQLQRQPQQQQQQQQHYHNFQRPSLPHGLSGMSGIPRQLLNLQATIVRAKLGAVYLVQNISIVHVIQTHHASCAIAANVPFIMPYGSQPCCHCCCDYVLSVCAVTPRMQL